MFNIMKGKIKSISYVMKDNQENPNLCMMFHSKLSPLSSQIKMLLLVTCVLIVSLCALIFMGSICNLVSVCLIIISQSAVFS